jgi:hypothetical protein
MAKVKAEEAKVEQAKVTELKPKASERISQEELLNWKLLLERQRSLQLELQLAQASLQTHIAQVSAAHGMRGADSVDPNTGAIVRAPAPAEAPAPAQSAS